MPDKYQALWLSYSAIQSFKECPLSYYFKYVYRDDAGRRIKLMSPPLALGQIVHEVLDSISVLPSNQRFKIPLADRLESLWPKISGEKGGFLSRGEENDYKRRALEILRRINLDPGPLANLAVKIKTDLPYFWLSEEEEIILCGRLDWMEYLPETDAVHIIDFKTGHKTKEESLQLPIYHLLASKCQSRLVAQASYWFLEKEEGLISIDLPKWEDSREKVLAIGREMKTARVLDRFRCPQGEQGCPACNPFRKIVEGEALFVGTDEYDRAIYVLDRNLPEKMPESEIL